MKVSVHQPQAAKGSAQQINTQTSPLTKLKRPQPQSKQTSKMKKKKKTVLQMTLSKQGS